MNLSDQPSLLIITAFVRSKSSQLIRSSPDILSLADGLVIMVITSEGPALYTPPNTSSPPVLWNTTLEATWSCAQVFGWQRDFCLRALLVSTSCAFILGAFHLRPKADHGLKRARSVAPHLRRGRHTPEAEVSIPGGRVACPVFCA